MKKVLFATTALIATAGMAAADMTWSGSARFGVIYAEDQSNTDQDEWFVHNRFTLNFDGTAETDSGAEFFARVRIRGGNTGETGLNNSGVSAPRVGVRSGGLTVAVGNINGAFESTPGLYSGAVGLTGLSWGNLPVNASGAGAFAWDSFSSAGAGSNGIEVIYSANGFGFHLSHSGSSEVSAAVAPTATFPGAAAVNGDRTAIHLSYKFSDWTVAVAHQESDRAGEDMTLLTVGGSFGGFKVGLAHALNEGDFDATRINAAYDVSAATTIVGYATFVQNDGQEDAFGLGVEHSLGGATLAGGISRTFGDQTVADMGVRFNF